MMQREELSKKYAQILEKLKSDDRERLAPALRSVPGWASQGPDQLRNDLAGLDDLLADLREKLEVLRAQPGSPQEANATELEAEIERLEARRQELQELLKPGPNDGEDGGPDDRDGGAAGGPEPPDAS